MIGSSVNNVKRDTKNCLTNHMISEHKQPCEVFKCDACEFETSRKMGLTIHMSKKHDVIEQLDGNSEKLSDLNKTVNDKSKHDERLCWK